MSCPSPARTSRPAALVLAGALGVLGLAGCQSANGDAANKDDPSKAAKPAAAPAAASAPTPVSPTLTALANAAPAEGGSAEVVLKNGTRIPAAKPPVVALGKVIYETADGARHVLAQDLVDLEATRTTIIASPQAAAGDRRATFTPNAASPLPAAGSRRAAPEFEAVGMDGKPVKLSDLKGKVVLVDFWATWCGPCVQEMPNVKRAYEQYGKDGFRILGVSLDHDRAKLDAYIKAQGLAWPQQFDGAGWGNEVARSYGVGSIPHTVLVDRTGKIARTGVRGPLLAQAIQQLLDEKS